jgi:hypothetical protein
VPHRNHLLEAQTGELPAGAELHRGRQPAVEREHREHHVETGVVAHCTTQSQRGAYPQALGLGRHPRRPAVGVGGGGHPPLHPGVPIGADGAVLHDATFAHPVPDLLELDAFDLPPGSERQHRRHLGADGVGVPGRFEAGKGGVDHPDSIPRL